jgi:hypothetical protein
MAEYAGAIPPYLLSWLTFRVAIEDNFARSRGRDMCNGLAAVGPKVQT